MKLPPSQAYLRERFDYDKELGRLIWRPLDPVTTPEVVWKQQYVRDAGKPAGNYRQGKYRIHLLGSKWCAKRLIWQWHHGEDEALTLSYGGTVSCIDHDQRNTRIENLELCHRLPSDPRVRSVGGVDVRVKVVGR